MATIVNDRDKILLNTTPRLIATTVVISGSGSSFIKLKNNGGVSPTTILLTANTTVFTSPTFSWEYALSTSPGTWVSMGSGPTQTITGTTFDSLLGSTNTHANYRVTATQTGYLSSTSPVFAISITREADDSIVVNITRRDTIVNTDAAGGFTPPAANTGTVISVSRSNTALNYAASGPDSFSVSYSVTSGSVTYGSVTNAGTTSSYADITAMTTDTATVLFTVTVRDSSGASTTYNVTQTFTKVKAPDSVYSHYLAPPSCFLDIDNSGNVISYADAFTQYNVFQGEIDDTSNWTFTKVDRNVTSTITSGGLVQITSFGVTGTPSESSHNPVTGMTSTNFIGARDRGSSYFNGHFAYANGIYFAVPMASASQTWPWAHITTIYTSSDAITWTARTVPAAAYWKVVYSSARGFFLIGVNSATSTPVIARSADGTTGWADTSLTTALASQAFWSHGYAFGSDLYLIPDTSTSNLVKYNGSTWSLVTVTGRTANYVKSVVVANGIVVTVDRSNNLHWSTNNTTWTVATNNSSLAINWGDVTHDGSYFYISENTASSRLVRSIDGKYWEKFATTTLYNYTQLKFFNGKFVIGNGNSVVVKDKLDNTTQSSYTFTATLPDMMCDYLTAPPNDNKYVVFNQDYSASPTLFNSTRIVSNLNNASGNIGYVDITATKGLLSRTLTFIVQKASATSDVYTTNIIPSTTAFPANSDGTVLSYSGSSSIIATIRKNGVDETTLWTATTSVSSGITLTGSWPTYAVTAVSGTIDTGTVTITATKGNMIQTLVWTYTKDKSGVGGGVIVNSFNPVVSIGAYVSLTFKTNGRVEVKLTAAEAPRFLLNWIEPVSATVGNSYYVKATITGDALASGTTGSYQQLNADRTWVLDNTAGASPSSKYTDFKLYLSTSASDAGAAGYATTYLQADKL